MGQWEDVPTTDEGWQTASANGSDDPHAPQWEPAPPAREDQTPFGGVEAVDGLVYSEQVISPELQWQQPVNVPLPPQRPRPMPPTFQRAEPWKPGPDPEPVKAKGPNRTLKVIVALIIPFMILGLMAFVLFKVKEIYGL